MKVLRKNASITRIKEELDAASISYDPELPRDSLWDLYSEAKKMMGDVPIPPSEPSKAPAGSEEVFEAGPPTSQKPALAESVKKTDELAADNKEDSQKDSAPPSFASDVDHNETLCLIGDILSELTPFKASASKLIKYSKNPSLKFSISDAELELASKHHLGLRKHIRYNDTHHGVVLYAFNYILLHYKGGPGLDDSLSMLKQELMLRLNLKYDALSADTRRRYLKNSTYTWVRVAHENKDNF